MKIITKTILRYIFFSVLIILSIFSCKKEVEDNKIAFLNTNTPPQATFSITPANGTTETQFEFNANGCSDKEDPNSTLIVRWDWENDGIWDIDWSINKIAYHKFNNKGNFKITLEVRDTDGLQSAITEDLKVEKINTPPIAKFSIEPTIGSTSTFFEFDGSGSFDYEEPAINIQARWDFDGNGIWDTEWDNDKKENYSYNYEGEFEVKLKVKDTDGLFDSTYQSLKIINGVPCPGTPTITDNDGHVYNTILIGNQCWMRENLNIGTIISGTVLMQNNNHVEKYCYDNDPNNCDKYGGLYQWGELMEYHPVQGVQGLCPQGWHIPTDEEWKILEGTVDTYNSIGSQIWDEFGMRGYDAGYRLKSTSIDWDFEGNGCNYYGFSALPSGYNRTDDFINIGKACYFATSTIHNTNSFIGRWFKYSESYTIRNGLPNEYGVSVRCLRDY